MLNREAVEGDGFAIFHYVRRGVKGDHMSKDTFRGGVHPNDQKALTRDSKLQAYEASGDMVFPLSQHIGKPAKALVKKNDEVLVGQIIAEADGFVSANIVSSCSGKVKTIEKRRTLSGTMAECIVIENDGAYRAVEGEGQETDVASLTDEDILGRIKEAGIVGLGGAGFPTHVKLRPKDPAAIKYIIANGAECEPYITCNDQLVRTEADAVIDGLAHPPPVFIGYQLPDILSTYSDPCQPPFRKR